MSRDTITIRVEHRFAASPERVFDAWLDPDTAGGWLFATPTGQMQRVDIDARVGGRYAIVERREQGDAAHCGEYLEIDRPRRLVFTLSDDPARTGDRIVVEIAADDDDGSRLTLTHDLSAEYADYAERTESGWHDVLATLAGRLATPKL